MFLSYLVSRVVFLPSRSGGGKATMATPMATKRLKQDYIRLQRDPVPYIEAAPLPSNLLEWWADHEILLIVWFL